MFEILDSIDQVKVLNPREEPKFVRLGDKMAIGPLSSAHSQIAVESKVFKLNKGARQLIVSDGGHLFYYPKEKLIIIPKDVTDSTDPERLLSDYGDTEEWFQHFSQMRQETAEILANLLLTDVMYEYWDAQTKKLTSALVSPRDKTS